MPSGIVIVDKPADWTSQDVAARLRRVFDERRIGHGGTLDPMATGVLPIFIGRATRAVPYFEGADKCYTAGIRLGTVTDTQDTTGRVLSESNPCSLSELESILPQLTGEIDQVPPMYSAVKIGGKKMYELARKGVEVERKARKITIFSMELESTEQDPWLHIHCSKGTYVRTICHDLGQLAGCGATMSSLRRTKAGQYELAQSVPLETLLNCENPLDYLLPIDSLFADLPAYTLTPKQEEKCKHGNPIPGLSLEKGRYRVYSESGEFLMVANFAKGLLTTEKSFYEV